MKRNTLRVAEHLKKHRTITSLEAINLFGATRLSDIIYRLKYRHKLPIGMVMLEGKNRYGEPIRYGQYYLTKRKPK